MPPDRPVSQEPTGRTFGAWLERNVVAQRQAGYFLVHIPLVLGDIDAERLTGFSHVVEQFGDRTVRTTQSQNFVLRWVHENELPVLYARLADLDLANAWPPVLRNLIACTGAATCRLGICLSRGLATAVCRGTLRGPSGSRCRAGSPHSYQWLPQRLWAASDCGYRVSRRGAACERSTRAALCRASRGTCCGGRDPICHRGNGRSRQERAAARAGTRHRRFASRPRIRISAST